MAACVALTVGACGGGDAERDGSDGASGGAVVHLLDAATGEERWATTLPGGWSSTPVVVGDRVLVQVAEDCRTPEAATTLVALDAASGETVWTAPSATGCGWGDRSPLVTPDGAVVVAGGGLRGLDLAAGEERWRLPDGALRQPVAAGGVLLLGPADPDGSAATGAQRLDVATGTSGWSSTDLRTGDLLGGDGQLLVALAVVDGPGLQVQAVAVDSGAERWRADLPFSERLSVPVVGPAAVVVSVSDGTADKAVETDTGDVPERSSPPRSTVIAFDPATGQERWRHQYEAPAAPEDPGAGTSTPVAVAVDDEQVYELRPGVLQAFLASDGTTRWTTDLTWSAASAGALLRSRDHVVALGDDALLGVDARTGAERWTWPLSVPTWRARLGGGGASVVLVAWGRFLEPSSG